MSHLLYFRHGPDLKAHWKNEEDDMKGEDPKIGEIEFPTELIDALLEYIESLNIGGAVMVILPDLSHHDSQLNPLQKHPMFGEQNYKIITLDQQIARVDQKAVFDGVSEGVTKFILSTNIVETNSTDVDISKSKMKLPQAYNNTTFNANVWASKTSVEQLADFDVRKLSLLLRSGIERNPGPPDSEEEWTPQVKALKPLPIPRIREQSSSKRNDERVGRSTDKQWKRGRGRGHSLGREAGESLCECGKK